MCACVTQSVVLHVHVLFHNTSWAQQRALSTSAAAARQAVTPPKLPVVAGHTSTHADAIQALVATPSQLTSHMCVDSVEWLSKLAPTVSGLTGDERDAFLATVDQARRAFPHDKAPPNVCFIVQRGAGGTFDVHTWHSNGGQFRAHSLALPCYADHQPLAVEPRNIIKAVCGLHTRTSRMWHSRGVRPLHSNCQPWECERVCCVVRVVANLLFMCPSTRDVGIVHVRLSE